MFQKNPEKYATISDFRIFATFATSDFFSVPAISSEASHYTESKINFLLNVWPSIFFSFLGYDTGP